MSAVLPSPQSRLRNITLDTVIEYYDGPVLFSARDDLGHAYLAVAVERSDVYDTFLYVPVSEERLAAVRAGLVSLHTAFARPESPTAFIVANAERSSRVDGIDVSRIPVEWLPVEGE